MPSTQLLQHPPVPSKNFSPLTSIAVHWTVSIYIHASLAAPRAAFECCHVGLVIFVSAQDQIERHLNGAPLRMLAIMLTSGQKHALIVQQELFPSLSLCPSLSFRSIQYGYGAGARRHVSLRGGSRRATPPACSTRDTRWSFGMASVAGWLRNISTCLSGRQPAAAALKRFIKISLVMQQLLLTN